ncbi:MAG: DUF4351 domain-containing protein [Bryobacterales bacterium]|nr:DUF4351 domain-containing protein [Bryobacterales bacterium]
MPVTFDFNQSELFGPIYRKAREEGREQGYRDVVVHQLGVRFGDLPGWVHDRLEAARAPELEDLGIRLLTADSLESLFAR